MFDSLNQTSFQNRSTNVFPSIFADKWLLTSSLYLHGLLPRDNLYSVSLEVHAKAFATKIKFFDFTQATYNLTRKQLTIPENFVFRLLVNQ